MKNKEWDVPKEAPIPYFDPELSYELTGYKPINKTKGLDFNPEWFIEVRKHMKLQVNIVRIFLEVKI